MADRDAVRAFYRALDDHRYESFERLLTEGFVHQRPDRDLEGRAAFVSFMRDDRPLYRTGHELATFYEPDEGDELLVRGTLRDEDGEALFDFLDRHCFEGDRIARVETYTSR